MSEQNRAIIVRAEADPDSNRYSTATFDVKLHFLGQDDGKTVDLKLFEIERDSGTGAVSKKTLLEGATVRGTLKKLTGAPDTGGASKAEMQQVAYLMAFKPIGSAKSSADPTKPRINFFFESSANPFFVELPDGKPRELQLRIKLPSDGGPSSSASSASSSSSSDPAAADAPDVIGSPFFNVSGHFVVPVGSEATYDWYSGNSVKFYSNASEDPKGDAGAFHDIGLAIDGAKHFVFIADWSFHPYSKLYHSGDQPGVKDTIGGILAAKVKKEKNLVVAIHTWDHAVVGAAKDPDNDFGDLQLRDLSARIEDDPSKSTGKSENLLWRASSHVGIGYSHHQKMVVVDCDAGDGRRDVKAFFGGLDLTTGRFDWWAHPIMPPPEVAARKADGGKSSPEAATAYDKASSAFFKSIPAPGYQYSSSRFGGLAKQLGSKGGEQVKGFTVNTEREYDDWYNAEFSANPELPRQPWHDIHAQITGPAAWDMVREFVGRWNVDAATPEARGDKDAAAITKVVSKFAFMLSEKKDDNTYLFVQQWEKRKPSKDGQFVGQVLRSIMRAHWGQPAEGNWFPTRIQVVGASPKEFDWIIKNDKYEQSIQDAYIRAISGAQRFVYIESQYFIGAGIWVKSINNLVPKTIVNRVLQMIEKKKPFHVYIVIPMFPEGDPNDDALRIVREYEASSVEYIATNIQAACDAQAKKDSSFKNGWKDYVSFYFPARWDRRGTVDITGTRKERVSKNQRYMIYVHSKMMIVDDEFIIIGSANLNERSLAGNRDTEVCIGMTAEDKAARDAIQNFRLELWSELLGNGKAKAAKKDSWKTPETPDCVGEIRTRTVNNYISLRTNSFNDNSGFLCRLPLDWEKGKLFGWNLLFLKDPSDSKNEKADWPVLPDAANEGTRWVDNTPWRWDSPGALRSLTGPAIRLTDLPE